jgi:hypothetical protein
VPIAVLAGEAVRRRLAAFFIAFMVWDLTSYLFLRVLDGPGVEGGPAPVRRSAVTPATSSMLAVRAGIDPRAVPL